MSPAFFLDIISLFWKKFFLFAATKLSINTDIVIRCRIPVVNLYNYQTSILSAGHRKIEHCY
jgi:hypothetical protein